MHAEQTTAIFVAELMVLLFAGRVLGEGLSRIGQPAIFGQLLAGVLLGPSVLGALLPGLHHTLFPNTPALKSMIDAVAQIGILLLLLLTGMETNLALVNRKRRAVVSTSLCGILVPFAFGVALAYAMPAELIPDPEKKLLTALFLGVALAISSVKIVAMVLMEVGAIRRDLGQLILATAILDDTIAWVLIAVIAGMASHGSISLTNIGGSVLGAVAFLTVSLTLGRRLVAAIIRWTNDNLTIEVPVITAILLVMLSMSLTTELIGVHTALGAFVAGILIGQSPILTEHIEAELRGLILAFFSPVFFAVAGLGMDLKSLMDPALLGITLAVIAVATVGKFAGALAGGLLGGLTAKESLALAAGLNARGSTEVIIASTGLAMGVLSNQLYTMIVAMAVITTMAMPPALRFMLSRVPLREEEARRLEKEDAEEHEIVPQIERALIYLDDSANAKFAAQIAGTFAAERQISTTVMQRADRASPDEPGRWVGFASVFGTAQAVQKLRLALSGEDESAGSDARDMEELIHDKSEVAVHGLPNEAAKGYGIAMAGISQPISATTQRFDRELQELIDVFEQPLVFAVNGERFVTGPGEPLRILVPTGGASHARLAIEFAIALAKATQGSLTVLHVFETPEGMRSFFSPARRLGVSVLGDAKRIGQRNGVMVRTLTAANRRPEVAIRREVATAQYDLMVVGTRLRVGDRKFLGPRSAALMQSTGIPILLMAQ